MGEKNTLISFSNEGELDEDISDSKDKRDDDYNDKEFENETDPVKIKAKNFLELMFLNIHFLVFNKKVRRKCIKGPIFKVIRLLSIMNLYFDEILL